MPTPIEDLGDPYINLLHAFWRAVKEDVRGEAPIFGHVPSRYRGLPADQRATIEKEIARQHAETFLVSPRFTTWVNITSAMTDTDISPLMMRKAMYARN